MKKNIYIVLTAIAVILTSIVATNEVREEIVWALFLVMGIGMSLLFAAHYIVTFNDEDGE
jgi:hypothetical membrane protein